VTIEFGVRSVVDGRSGCGGWMGGLDVDGRDRERSVDDICVQ
jgi:hypothetical protein